MTVCLAQGAAPPAEFASGRTDAAGEFAIQRAAKHLGGVMERWHGPCEIPGNPTPS